MPATELKLVSRDIEFHAFTLTEKNRPKLDDRYGGGHRSSKFRNLVKVAALRRDSRFSGARGCTYSDDIWHRQRSCVYSGMRNSTRIGDDGGDGNGMLAATGRVACGM